MPTSLQDRLANLRAAAERNRQLREQEGGTVLETQQLPGFQTPRDADFEPPVVQPTATTASSQPSRTSHSQPDLGGFDPEARAGLLGSATDTGQRASSGTSLADIVRKTVTADRDRANQSGADFSNAATFQMFEFGGQSYQVDQKTGRLQHVGAATVQQGQNEQNKVIGVRSDGSRFNLGDAVGGLGFATTKEQSLEQLGVTPARGTGTTKTSGQIGDVNFAGELNLREDPSKGENETTEQFQIRLYKTRAQNIANAYNATMKSFEQQRLREALQNEQIIPLSVLKKSKTKSQLEAELRHDNKINSETNAAKDAFKASRNAQMEQSIKNRSLKLKGSEASKRVVREAIEKEERRKAKEDISAENGRIDSVRQDIIKKTAQGLLSQRNESLKMAAKFEGKSDLEIQQEFDRVALEKKTELFLNANPGMTVAEAQSKAKASMILTKKNPTLADKFNDLDEFFASPSNEEKYRGSELGVAFTKLRNLKDVKTYAQEVLLLPQREIDRQIKELRKIENPHLSEEQLQEDDKLTGLRETMDKIRQGGGDSLITRSTLGSLKSQLGGDFAEQFAGEILANPEIGSDIKAQTVAFLSEAIEAKKFGSADFLAGHGTPEQRSNFLKATRELKAAQSSPSKANVTVGAGGAFPNLSNSDRIIGSSLAIELYGSRQGLKPENLNPILRELNNGRTVDDIRDDIAVSHQSEDFGAYRRAFDFASSGLAKERAARSEDSLDRILEAGDSRGAKDFILKIARDASTAEERKQANGRDDAIKSINAIDEALTDYISAGGDTGLITGSLEGFRQRVLKKTGDVELARLSNEIAVSIQTYRKAVSGAAFTESEAKEYESIFPSIGKSPELNKAKIDSVRTIFARNQRNFYTRQIGERNYSDMFESDYDLSPRSIQEITPEGDKDIEQGDIDFYNNLQ